MVTEDRKTLGLFDKMTVAENITIRRLPELTFGAVPLIDPRAERRAVEWSIKELAIKTAGGDAPVTSLSGGNQQKCIIARWLLVEPRLLLLDEPTRGIDVGAKSEIYQLIRRLAAQGRAILMTSSELPELLAVADRIIVLCEGRITAEIPRAEATEEAIMHAATRFLDRAKAGGRRLIRGSMSLHPSIEPGGHDDHASVISSSASPPPASVVPAARGRVSQVPGPGDRPACRRDRATR